MCTLHKLKIKDIADLLRTSFENRQGVKVFTSNILEDCAEDHLSYDKFIQVIAVQYLQKVRKVSDTEWDFVPKRLVQEYLLNYFIDLQPQSVYSALKHLEAKSGFLRTKYMDSKGFNETHYAFAGVEKEFSEAVEDDIEWFDALSSGKSTNAKVPKEIRKEKKKVQPETLQEEQRSSNLFDVLYD
jgi:DNA-binding PadR family transcriptional regulator